MLQPSELPVSCWIDLFSAKQSASGARREYCYYVHSQTDVLDKGFNRTLSSTRMKLSMQECSCQDASKCPSNRHQCISMSYLVSLSPLLDDVLERDSWEDSGNVGTRMQLTSSNWICAAGEHCLSAQDVLHRSAPNNNGQSRSPHGRPPMIPQAMTHATFPLGASCRRCHCNLRAHAWPAAVIETDAKGTAYAWQICTSCNTILLGRCKVSSVGVCLSD